MESSTRTIALSAGISALVSIVATTIALQAIPSLQSVESSSSGSTVITGLGGTREEDIIRTVDRTAPAVASVIISRNLPVLQRYYEDVPVDSFLGRPFNLQVPRLREQGTELREVGGGTAFFVSADGLLLTNRHVVEDDRAEYTVLLNDGRRLKATIVGRDPITDIALLKVEGTGFPVLPLAPTNELQLGQTVIAIGNALAEFRNTVSVGVVSGLQRSIIAGGLMSGEVERLNRIIQTDAAINAGNSGGPLLDSKGYVIGMSTAVASDAQNVGFAIPVGDLRRVLTSYEKEGRIVRPYIGVRYVAITPELAESKKLPVQEGMLVSGGETPDTVGIIPGSPAEKAGLKDGDIIVAIDGQALNEDLTIGDVIQTKLPGDRISLTILRAGKEQTIPLTLEEWQQ